MRAAEPLRPPPAARRQAAGQRPLTTAGPARPPGARGPLLLPASASTPPGDAGGPD